MRPTFAGPGSSTGNYKPTSDPGKQVGTGPSTTSGYRRVGQATGPGSSHTTYTWQGKIYYFCCSLCREKFIQNPQLYDDKPDTPEFLFQHPHN